MGLFDSIAKVCGSTPSSNSLMTHATVGILSFISFISFHSFHSFIHSFLPSFLPSFIHSFIHFNNLIHYKLIAFHMFRMALKYIDLRGFATLWGGVRQLSMDWATLTGTPHRCAALPTTSARATVLPSYGDCWDRFTAFRSPWSYYKLLWFDPLAMGYHRTYEGTYHQKLPIQPLQIQVRQILRSNASCPNCSPFCPGTVQVSSTQVSCISNCKDSGWSKPNMILSLLLMLRHEWQVKRALPSGNMTQQCRCPFPKKSFKGNSTVQLVKHRLVLKPLEFSCPFL